MLNECSEKKGTIERLLLRKDLLTKIKQCDGELSNVLQAFQVRTLSYSCELCDISPRRLNWLWTLDLHRLRKD